MPLYQQSRTRQELLSKSVKQRNGTVKAKVMAFLNRVEWELMVWEYLIPLLFLAFIFGAWAYYTLWNS